MNHAVVTEHLADYLEGDLALDLRALVDAHLDTCSDCALEVREMQQTIRILRALPEPETPPMIAANVMRRIRAGETEPSFFERIARVLGGVLEPSFVLPASAMAVAALVIFVIQGGRPLADLLGAADDAGGEEAVALHAASQAVTSGAEETERNFGASAARELAAAPSPRHPTAALSPARTDSPSSTKARDDVAGREPSYASRDSMFVESWDSQPARQGLRRSPGFGDPGFGDPVLAQGFATEVSGPGATSASNRISGGFGSAMPTSVARPIPGAPQGLRFEDSGGEDPRDAWLARALENPVEFAQYIARHNLAEQELWVERLSERAMSRGLLTEVVAALRAAGNEKASWLADDFAAQGGAEDASKADGEAVRPSDGNPALDR